LLCTADLEGYAVRVQVAAKGEGLEYKTLDAVYDLGPAAEELAGYISAEVESAVTLSCGEGLKVVPIGDSFDCTAADETGDTRTIRITNSPNGDFWEVLD
jgi:tartrate dehydratase alpha subunit/fumarate hydratase class I-like protein